MIHPSTCMPRTLAHFLIKYLKNSLKFLTSVKSNFLTRALLVLQYWIARLGKAFWCSLKRPESDYISTPTFSSTGLTIALLPSKNIWNQKTDAAEEREKSLWKKTQSCLRHKARNSQTKHRKRQLLCPFWDWNLRTWTFLLGNFSLHCDGENAMLKANEKQITP